MNFRIAASLLAACVLAACASEPRPLQGEFAQVTPRDAADGDMTGAMVRWGGRIVRTEPMQNRTCFEMISTRVDTYARPYWASDADTGRFIACRTGFYDPAVFQANREVTFTGRVEGYEMRRIGQYEYRFPRVAADVVYLWPYREHAYMVSRPAPWPWWGWW